jgi:hypothetical protein
MWTGEDYDTQIIDPAGTFLGDKKSKFMILYDPNDEKTENEILRALVNVAQVLKETVDFGVFNILAEEKLKYTLECYHTPCYYMVDSGMNYEGKTHALLGWDN